MRHPKIKKRDARMLSTIIIFFGDNKLAKLT